MTDNTPIVTIAAASLAIAFFAFVCGVSYLFSPPTPCLVAPEVVTGWYTVRAHPESRLICGWHQASVQVPIYMCVRLKAIPCH